MTAMNATPTRRVRADDAGHLKIPREWLKPIGLALAGMAAGGGITFTVASSNSGATVATPQPSEVHTLLSEFREFRAETRTGVMQLQVKLADTAERVSRIEGALTKEPASR